MKEETCSHGHPLNVAAMKSHTVPAINQLRLPHKKWIICDIDGTIADISHRLAFLPKKDTTTPPDWTAFNEACRHDPVIPSTVSLLRLAHEAGWVVALSTGRNELYRGMTEEWLKGKEVPYDLMMMRPEKDYRSDTIIKHNHYLQEFRFRNVVLVLEDRDKCVDMWRGLGLPCLQVRKGDY